MSRSRLPWKDSVPAMLAPKEAVLNPPAADMIGRDKIRMANKAGIDMFTKPEPGIHTRRYPFRRYQFGTPNVPYGQGGPSYGQRPLPDPRMPPTPFPRPNMAPDLGLASAAGASGGPPFPPPVPPGNQPPPYPASSVTGSTPGLPPPMPPSYVPQGINQTEPSQVPPVPPSPQDRDFDDRQGWRQELRDRFQVPGGPRWPGPGPDWLPPYIRRDIWQDRREDRRWRGPGQPQSFAEGIGYVSPQDVDPAWQDIQLSAPHIDFSALKSKAQENGLSAMQTKGLLQALIQGIKSRNPTGTASDWSSNLTQGVTGYKRGTADVGGPVVDDWGKTIGGGATPAWFTPPGGQGPSSNPDIEPTPIPDVLPGNRTDKFEGAGLSDFAPVQFNAWYGSETPDNAVSFGYIPPQNTLGFDQGPTMLPTFFDPQGYPYAVPTIPYFNPSDPVGLIHQGQTLKSR